MGKSKARTRRIRRKWNAVARFGRSAGPRHTLVGGRTGSKFEKELTGRRPPEANPVTLEMPSLRARRRARLAVV